MAFLPSWFRGVLITLSLFAGPSSLAEPPPNTAGAEVQKTQSESARHFTFNRKSPGLPDELAKACVDLAGSSAQAAAVAAQVTALAWAQTSAEYSQTGTPHLLYWRGVLGFCLDQHERAADDFARFIHDHGKDKDYEELVEDAGRRLRILRKRMGPRRAPGPGAAKP